MHGKKKGPSNTSNIIELNGTEVPFNKQLDPDKLHHDYNISRPLRQSAENMLKQVGTPSNVRAQDMYIPHSSPIHTHFLAHQNTTPIHLESSKLNKSDTPQNFKKHHTHKFNRDVNFFNVNARNSPPQKSRFTPVPGVTDMKASNTKVLQSSYTSGSPPKFNGSFIPAQLVASSSITTIHPVSYKSTYQYNSTPELLKNYEVILQNQGYEYKKNKNLSPFKNSSITSDTHIYSTNTTPQYISESSVSSTSNLCYSKKPRVIDFKPYSINDYRKIKQIQNVKLGGLGPSYLGSEEWERKMAKNKTMKEYGELLRSQGIHVVHTSESNEGSVLDLRSSNPVLRRFRGELFEASPN